MSSSTHRPLLANYDRRRYRRYRLSLAGRYMLESRREFACRTIDISADGASLAAPVAGLPGEHIIAYIDHIGRIEGALVRTSEHGFTMTIAATVRKRDRLAATLDWLADRASDDGDELRSHGRVIPHNPFSFLTLPDGEALRCRILDMSLVGAALALDAEPAIGTPVRLGDIPARVARHFAGGLAISFVTVQSEETLAGHF